jgi:hypothetical protein
MYIKWRFGKPQTVRLKLPMRLVSEDGKDSRWAWFAQVERQVVAASNNQRMTNYDFWYEYTYYEPYNTTKFVAYRRFV